MVKKFLFAATALVICLAAARAQKASASPADKSSQPTPAQLRQMARDAHTTEQYATLARFYDQLAKSYLARADEERQEWQRRSQNVVSIAAKYPRPVDSARNLYEYYAYKATEAGGLAAKYRGLAEPASAPAAR